MGSICGISNLTPVESAIPGNVLSDVNVEMISIGANWSTVQPSTGSGPFTHGTDNWSYFATGGGTGQIQRAVANGKRVIVGIADGGGFASGLNSHDSSPENGSVPDWVATDMGVNPAGIVNVRNKVFVRSDGVCIPVWYDPTFKARKKSMMAAFANFLFNTGPLTVAEKAAIVGVRFGICNSLTDDWNMPSTPTDINTWAASHDYTTIKMHDMAIGPAADGLIDQAMTSFPNQYILTPLAGDNNNLDLTQANMWGTYYKDNPTMALANKIADDAWAAYPGRHISAQNSLSAHMSTDFSAFQQRIYDAGRLTGGQSVWRCSGDPTWRMCNPHGAPDGSGTNEDPDNPGVFLTPDQIARRTFLNCRSFINTYFEYYQVDIQQLPRPTPYAYGLYHQPVTPLGHIVRL